MTPGPGLDILHGRLRQRQFAFLGQPLSYGDIRPAVMVGVGKADYGTVGQLRTFRTLYLQEEGFDRIDGTKEVGRLPRFGSGVRMSGWRVGEEGDSAGRKCE